MKRVLLMAGLLCALCTGAWAEEVSGNNRNESSKAGESGFFSAERSEERMRTELRVGLAVSQMAAVDGGSSMKGYRRMGYHVGIAIDVPILQSLGFQTGLQFVQKGLKEEDISTTGALVQTKSNPGYMEMPLLVSYRHAFRRKVQLQVNTGPFLALGISGKMKVRQEYAPGKMQTVGEVDWFGTESDTETARFRRFDMGWHVGARLRFGNKVSVGYSYEAGFVDCARGMGYKVKTRSHLVGLGFAF